MRRKNYIVNEDYFDHWSRDMAYVLGFIVADGNIQSKGHYVKVEVCPKDVSVLEFIRDQITPGYELRRSRPTEVRWYPASRRLKERLGELGVVPAKTGAERLPPGLPDSLFWNFLLGYFDGDGTVNRDSVSIVSNGRGILDEVRERSGLGSVIAKGGNHYWSVWGRSKLRVLYERLYACGGFCLERKRSLLCYACSEPARSGEFSSEEDDFLKRNIGKLTQMAMAAALKRSARSINNRLCKLRKRGELSVA